MNPGKSSPSNKKSHNSKSDSSDRYLVAEQPGKAIFLSGLAVAVVLGYTVSSLFSPGRVTQRIRDAATHINRDVQVDFQSAEMSFRSGIFPRLSIVINSVRMQSEKNCWGAPELSIDQMILPLSISGLLKGDAPIPKIYANKVQLRIRGNFKNCDENNETPISAVASLKSTGADKTAIAANLVRLKPLENVTAPEAQKTDVQALHINQLLISADALPSVRTEFLNFKAQVVSAEPRVIEVTAQTHLLKNSQVGDYLSHANIFLEYRESPARRIQTHFFGNWREGHYSVIANYTLDEQLLALESDLRHIPLSQIMAVLNKYQLTNVDLDARQIWVSGQTQLVSSIDELRKAPLQVRDFKIEGDLGEISVANFRVLSLDPLRYEPLQMSIQKLDVESLLTFLKRPAKSPIFANLGQFSGRGQINSADEVSLSGEHSGLEFVFSNKGQREVQALSRIVGDVSLNKDKWKFKIQRADPVGGVLVGGLDVESDRDFKDVTMKARIEELTFSTKVQRLMTSGGDLGPFSLDADLSLQEGVVKNLKGLLQVSQMNIEGLFVLRSKFQFRLAPDALAFQYSNKNMVIDPQSPAMNLLGDVVKVVGLNPATSLKVDQFQGEFKLNKQRDFSWSKTQGRLNSASTFVTDGAWSPAGQLRGQLHLKDKTRQGRWLLQGTRDLPILTPQTSNRAQN